MSLSRPCCRIAAIGAPPPPPSASCHRECRVAASSGSAGAASATRFASTGSPEGPTLLRAIRYRQHWNDGFTLIEVLVALAVVAASLAAIGSLIATSVRGAHAVEQHVALVERTRAIMAALPRRNELSTGQVAGEAAGCQSRRG